MDSFVIYVLDSFERICCTDMGSGLVSEILKRLTGRDRTVILKPQPVYETIETTSRCSSGGFVCPNSGSNKFPQSMLFISKFSFS